MKKEKTGKCFICAGAAQARRDEHGKPYRILLCERRECHTEAWRLVREAAARLPKPEKNPEPAPKAASGGIGREDWRLNGETIERIRGLREKGYTYQAIVNKTGVSQKTIAKYTRGTRQKGAEK